MKGRRAEHAAVVFESFLSSTFRRQVSRVLQIEAEQITQRVVVFVGGEASQDIPPAGGPLRFHRLPKRCCECLNNDLPFGAFGLSLRLFRWHLADVDQVEHFLPHVCVAAKDHVGVELVDTQISFLFAGTVTAHTILREKRPNVRLVTLPV